MLSWIRHYGCVENGQRPAARARHPAHKGPPETSPRNQPKVPQPPTPVNANNALSPPARRPRNCPRTGCAIPVLCVACAVPWEGSMRRVRAGFAHAEMLIVVIRLGMLAAVVIPRFEDGPIQARRVNLSENLGRIRMQMALCWQHRDRHPGRAEMGCRAATTEARASRLGRAAPAPGRSPAGAADPGRPVAVNNTARRHFAANPPTAMTCAGIRQISTTYPQGRFLPKSCGEKSLRRPNRAPARPALQGAAARPFYTLSKPPSRRRR
jgi:hypothetical protein